MSDAIIKVEGRGKRYRLGASRSNERYTALRDVLTEKAKGLFRREPQLSDVSSQLSKDDFWALKNVSFEVRRGEVIASCPASGSERATARRERDTLLPGCLTDRKRARRGIIGRKACRIARKSLFYSL